MNEFKNVDDILDFAIQNEQSAVEFYTELAKGAISSEMKATFEHFAQEEIGHKAKLLKIKAEKIFTLGTEKILELKISDYLETVHPTPGMSYQDALIVAMKREKSAFKLYTNLAEKTDSKDLKNLFLSLAQEESKHKLIFEIEYDEMILKEN
jgi:rubrerythrin